MLWAPLCGANNNTTFNKNKTSIQMEINWMLQNIKSENSNRNGGCGIIMMSSPSRWSFNPHYFERTASGRPSTQARPPQLVWWKKKINRFAFACGHPLVKLTCFLFSLMCHKIYKLKKEKEKTSISPFMAYTCVPKLSWSPNSTDLYFWYSFVVNRQIQKT